MNVRKVEKTIRLEKGEFFCQNSSEFQFPKKYHLGLRSGKRIVYYLPPLPQNFNFSRFDTSGNATHKSST